MSAKTAFITGITGQDGSYLADLLLARDYVVHGLVRRPESVSTSNIAHLAADPSILGKRLFLHRGTLEASADLRDLIRRIRPGELYHLAGDSVPRKSFQNPEATFDSIGRATLHLLEVLRELDHPCRLLYASSSEVFGSPDSPRQDETSPIRPTTPYGAAKAYAQQLVQIYRAAHGLTACSAIPYNHESPRRGPDFVTMKIASAVARIHRGRQSSLTLGALDARRDWGWAPDYVRGMMLAVEAGATEDFVLATGQLHSVEELVEIAFQSVGLDWRDYVHCDPALLSPDEPVAPCGDAGKARRLLEWSPTMSFESMVGRLVKAELDKLE